MPSQIVPFLYITMEKIQPIENFIFDGVVKRLQQVFGCYVQYCNAPNTLLEMQKIRKRMSFPFMLFSLSGMSAMDDYYHTNYLARKGLVIGHSTENVLQKVKVLPCKFDFNCNYYTDANAGTNSVLFFMKRWLFARRLGYLKFTVNYGKSSYGCHVELDESLTQPDKEVETDTWSFYKTECRFSVVGYISEPQVLTDGVVTTVRTELKVDGSTESTTDYTWNNYGQIKKR